VSVKKYLPIICLCLMLMAVVTGTNTEAGEMKEAPKGTLLHEELATDLVPGPAKYDVLLPPGYEDLKGPLPLLVWLHGGGSGVNHIERKIRVHVERAWADGVLSPTVIVAPITGPSYYIDWKDGSQKWETFIIRELIPHVRKTYKVRKDREGTVLAGASAGGQGTLRIGLRNPEVFIAAAAMEPGFKPVMSFDELDITTLGPDPMTFLTPRFGDPVDTAYWRARHPPTIVVDNADRIRSSGIQLRIEAGDEDANLTWLSAELVHRLLFDAAIPHEYYIERGAAHVGRSMPRRLSHSLEFLERVLHPPQGPDPDAERHLAGAKKSGRYAPRTVNQLRYKPVEFAPPK
jgi:S-formylglutathione hydrolase